MTGWVRSALVLGVLAGCGARGDAERTGRAASAILAGAKDTSHDGVVAVLVPPNDAIPSGSVCTGVMVTPNVVVTALHCVVDHPKSTLCEDVGNERAPRVTAPVAAKSVKVTRAPAAFDDAGDMADPVDVAEVIADEADAGAVLCGHDVAVLVLAKPLDVTVYEPKLDGPPAVGAPFTAAGYGRDAPNGEAGIRRSAPGMVASIGELRHGDGVLAAVERDWVADAGACNGDSGGPAIAADGRVLGILSRSEPTCAEAKYTRIDVYGDLLRRVARDAASNAGIDVASWAVEPKAAPPPPDAPATPASDERGAAGSGGGCAVAVPERSSAWLVAIAAVVVVVARRRRRFTPS